MRLRRIEPSERAPHPLKFSKPPCAFGRRLSPVALRVPRIKMERMSSSRCGKPARCRQNRVLSRLAVPWLRSGPASRGAKSPRARVRRCSGCSTHPLWSDARVLWFSRRMVQLKPLREKYFARECQDCPTFARARRAALRPSSPRQMWGCQGGHPGRVQPGESLTGVFQRRIDSRSVRSARR
jgi:hypothetical protein